MGFPRLGPTYNKRIQRVARRIFEINLIDALSQAALL